MTNFTLIRRFATASALALGLAGLGACADQGMDQASAQTAGANQTAIQAQQAAQRAAQAAQQAAAAAERSAQSAEAAQMAAQQADTTFRDGMRK